jgi:error-prone DNA polymerase
MLPENAFALQKRVMSEAGSVHDDKLDTRFALRMGLRFVKGLGVRERNAILTARATSPFTSLADFQSRTALDAGALDALAEAGAFGCFDIERRAALWDARGLATAVPPTLFDDEQTPRFADLSELETIAWDYARSSHSTRGHPLAPLRAELRALDLPTAAEVSALEDGELVHYAGLVICRQRPATASGVTFMTLEDETGFVNLIVRRAVFEEHELIVRTEAFLGVSGRSQVQQGVVHILAEDFWRPPIASPPPHVDSHDFH